MMHPNEALEKLLEGNQRYAADRMLNPNRSVFRRQETLQEQNPFAVVVGCSDSRVAPEIIFDRGLGDLFIIRIAGNVIGPIEKDSIDFSVRTLGAKLVLILGHESCGAVSAVYENNTEDIEEIAFLIKPSLKNASSLEEAIKANVIRMVGFVKKSPVLKPLLERGDIAVRGAYYHLGSGLVEIL